MLSYIARKTPQCRLGDDGMRDIILLAAVLAYMLGGYFVVGKLGEFFDKNYRGCDDDFESDKTLY